MNPYPATTRFAEFALKALLTLNGGAAVALLAFMSHANMSHAEKAASSLGKALMYFGAGAAVSVVTAFLAYLTQFEILEQDRSARSFLLRRVTIAIGVVGFALFLVGLRFAQLAAVNLLAHTPGTSS